MSSVPKNITATTRIYILKCPINLQIRYVGKTVKPISHRLSDHICLRNKDKSYRANWVKSLKRLGLKPIIEQVDECPWNESQGLEIYWIAKLKREGCKLVNGTIGGEGTTGKIMSKKSKDMLSKIKRSKSKKIYQYSISGKFIKEWKGFLDAAEALKLNSANISACCYNRRNKCGNFRWSFNYINELGLYIGSNKYIIQYDLENNFIREYSSIKEAGIYNSICNSHISECCKGKRQSAGKYKWKYKDEIVQIINSEEDKLKEE